MLHAQEVATQAQAEVLRGYLYSPNISPEEKVKKVTKLFTDLGVKEATEGLMNQYFEEGMENLAKLEVPEERKQVLHRFAVDLMGRTK